MDRPVMDLDGYRDWLLTGIKRTAGVQRGDVLRWTRPAQPVDLVLYMEGFRGKAEIYADTDMEMVAALRKSSGIDG